MSIPSTLILMASSIGGFQALCTGVFCKFMGFIDLASCIPNCPDTIFKHLRITSLPNKPSKECLMFSGRFSFQTQFQCSVEAKCQR
ncbi:hypothetical protein GLYMA_19G157750v4 [Glycine max]|nr:hypothetical protein GLYMA_19G157750v4 [Glycine max]KAH1078014.1 hypothetical protein GYH30_053192 [Glycine max]